MRFKLFARDELLGYSDLEGADPSMGGRVGSFVPHENYSKYQPMFREKSRLGYSMLSKGIKSAEYEELRARINSLLRVETSDGERVGITQIDIEDFSDELGDDGYQLQIIVDDRRTYEEFFEQSVLIRMRDSRITGIKVGWRVVIRQLCLGQLCTA